MVILLTKPYVLYGIGVSPNNQQHYDNDFWLLSPEQIEEYDARIKRFFAVYRPFLRQGYSLPDLAEETGIPRHHLSAYINKSFRVNFNEFINRYRVEYALHSLEKEKWKMLSIQGVAQEVGFGARSTFLRAFKQQTGLSPSEYREQLLREN